MPITDARVLPTPSRVEVLDQQVVQQSDPSQGVLLTRAPDPQVQPTAWLLEWREKPGAVGQVLLEHGEAFGVGTWPWRPPGDSHFRQVRYVQLPEVRWRGGSKCSARAVVELATAHE